jgi:hypothetical protein
MLEGLEIKVIRFSCSKLNEESEYLKYDNLSERKCYDESVHGNVKLTIDSEHFCRINILILHLICCRRNE